METSSDLMIVDKEALKVKKIMEYLEEICFSIDQDFNTENCEKFFKKINSLYLEKNIENNFIRDMQSYINVFIFQEAEIVNCKILYDNLYLLNKISSGIITEEEIRNLKEKHIINELKDNDNMLNFLNDKFLKYYKELHFENYEIFFMNIFEMYIDKNNEDKFIEDINRFINEFELQDNEEFEYQLLYDNLSLLNEISLGKITEEDIIILKEKIKSKNLKQIAFQKTHTYFCNIG